MRSGMAAVALGLCLAAPAGAQFIGTAQSANQIGSAQAATSFFTGVNPRQINFQVINVNEKLKSFNTTQVIRPRNLQPSAFNLSNIFHPFSMPKLWTQANPPQIPKNPFGKK